MVKAIFFDIDGTLVSFKTHRLPESTVWALDRLREKGVRLFIASGRQYQSINNLGTQTFDGYVTLNGGYCLAGKSEVIYRHSIPPPLRPLRRNGGKAVYQLIAFFSPGQEKRIMSVLPHCEATRWNPLFADVIPAGSSKAVGIDKMLAYFGISLADTMAFGDGGNDVSMLRHVGIGVAMGNAGDEARRAADYVTTSVDEDGILNALRHFGVI